MQRSSNNLRALPDTVAFSGTHRLGLPLLWLAGSWLACFQKTGSWQLLLFPYTLTLLTQLINLSQNWSWNMMWKCWECCEDGGHSIGVSENLPGRIYTCHLFNFTTGAEHLVSAMHKLLWTCDDCLKKNSFQSRRSFHLRSNYDGIFFFSLPLRGKVNSIHSLEPATISLGKASSNVQSCTARSKVWPVFEHCLPNVHTRPDIQRSCTQRPVSESRLLLSLNGQSACQRRPPIALVQGCPSKIALDFFLFLILAF